MRKSEGQKIPEKEIVKQKFCKNFERGRILVRRARRCNREDLEQFQFDGVMDMKIREVNENKKQFISLLLLADEQESMVDRIECPCQTVNDFIGVRGSVCGLFLFVQTHAPLIVPPQQSRARKSKFHFLSGARARMLSALLLRLVAR